MRHLAQLQRDLQYYLLDPNRATVVSNISRNGRAAPTTQLAVYSDAYRLRLCEVLENDFPVLAAALGEERFTKLVDEYIEAHPSHGYSLRSFGAQLTTFLRNQPDYRETPVLAELATFEWGLGKAFDAVDDPVATTESLSNISPEAWASLRLKFHASVHHIDCRWNAPQIWKAHKTDSTSPQVRENAKLESWLIWRQDFKIRFRSLENDEQAFFKAARQGSTFAVMCDGLSAIIPPENVPLRAASLLKRWIHDGLVSRIIK